MIGGTIRTCNEKQQDFVYNPEPKILLIDADSIPYIAFHFCNGDLETAKFGIEEKLRDIQVCVEERFNIVKVMTFVKGVDNFRYKIDKQYKGNRKEKPPEIEQLFQWMRDNLQVIIANGMEVDDFVYTAWYLSNSNAVIATQDKDLKASCHGVFYDYRKKEFSFVSEKQQRYNFAIQLLTGDVGDNVKTCSGIGKVRAAKIVNIEMTDYQYKKAIYRKYKEFYQERAKELLTNTYNLLKLHHVNDLDLLNLQYGRNN